MSQENHIKTFSKGLRQDKKLLWLLRSLCLQHGDSSFFPSANAS